MSVKEELIDCTGYQIAGDFYEVEGSERALLILPSYRSEKSNQEDFASGIALRGISVLTINYSGQGNSPIELKNTTPALHLLETVTAFDWLTANNCGRVSVMGASYGGFHGAWLSQYRDFERLVLRTPALYLPRDMYTRSTDIDRETTAKVFRKDKDAVAVHPLFTNDNVFNGDTLVVVHGEDEDVPPETTDRYIEFFGAEVYVAEGFRHWSRDPANPPGMLKVHQDAVANWVSRA